MFYVQQTIKSLDLFELCVCGPHTFIEKTPLLFKEPYHLHSNNELGVRFPTTFNEKALTNNGILNLIEN